MEGVIGLRSDESQHATSSHDYGAIMTLYKDTFRRPTSNSEKIEENDKIQFVVSFFLKFDIMVHNREKEVRLKSVEAIIERDGEVRLKEPIHLNNPCRAIVTILDETEEMVSEIALLSEASFSEDWNRPEEDEAWAHLQKDR